MSSGPDRPRILVVDDEADLLEVLEVQLTESGYDVVVAGKNSAFDQVD